MRTYSRRDRVRVRMSRKIRWLSISVAASTATAVATPTAATLWRLGFGFVDHDASAFQIRAVEGRDRRIGVFPGRHLDKPESARFTAEPILDDAG